MTGGKAAGSGRDQRVSVRFEKQISVRTEYGEGTTRNISAQGVYFETDVGPRAGALVNFFIEYVLQGRRQRLLCEAKVLRVEPQGGRVGVAARLLAPFFESAESAEPAKPR